MVWNLILGALAGFLTPMAEPHIRRAIENLSLSEIPVGETEYDVLALLVMLLLASVLVALFGGDSAAFLLLVGAFIGLFGKRLVEAIANPRTTAAANPGTGTPYTAPARPQAPTPTPPRPTPPQPRVGEPRLGATRPTPPAPPAPNTDGGADESPSS